MNFPSASGPRAGSRTSGPAALSDAELLALVSGQQNLAICERSLREHQGWVGLLRADVRAVAASIGTPRKAASLKAALEIGRQLMIAGYEGRFQVTSPADVATLFMVEMMPLDQEELWVASLDIKNRVVKISKVYRGSVNIIGIVHGATGRAQQVEEHQALQLSADRSGRWGARVASAIATPWFGRGREACADGAERWST